MALAGAQLGQARGQRIDQRLIHRGLDTLELARSPA